MHTQALQNEQLPPEQQAIWLKCRHPSGSFAPFTREDIEQPIGARFERIAALYSNRLALETENGSMTYGELERASAAAAGAILDRADPGGGPALLLFEQGIDAIVALFGALRAAKPFVMLSPSFPRERIVAIIEDAGAGTFVTHSRHRELAASLNNRDDWLNVDSADSRSLDGRCAAVVPESIATVLYTSGSTGRPKGIVQTHRGIMHRAMVYTNMLRVCAADRLTLLHAPGFGSGIHHLFSALLNGATLYPFDPASGGGPPLIRWLARENITLYHSAPSLFRELVGALPPGATFPHLRVISLTGAPIYPGDVELYKKHFSDHAILVHLMGATEAGWIRRYTIDKTTSLTHDAVPVGYPVEDKIVSLLDDNGDEAPLGETGEILVRSRYLAAGYWKNPGLTAEKFTPVAGGETIYRIGDLGRFVDDHCLFHGGRRDFLTKIRGFRVEPGDIEAALRGLGEVREAAVTAVPREQESELVAYIVPRAGEPPSSTALRRALGEKLPDYMIPRIFVVLDALPLTPNGKLDRKALPAPPPGRPLIETAYAAPTTGIEEQLAQIWSEAFGCGALGIHDDFVELGGHSLLAARIVVKIQQAFGIELTVRQLLDTGTIAGLSSLLADACADKAAPAPAGAPLADEESDEI